MATFEVVEGPPGQGKSSFTANKARELLKRNKRWFENTGIKRTIASNMKFAEWVEKENEGWITYWSTMEDIVKLRDCDILWDEIATELDSRNWPLLSAETKRFLSQYRKRGVDIYANTQDFSMVDARARLMITGVKTLRKILGSRDISTTKPPPKTIWGVVWIRAVQNYKETDPEKKKYDFFDMFEFMFIDKDLTDMYDTTQDIPSSPPLPYKHAFRVCELHGKGCNFAKELHT